MKTTQNLLPNRFPQPHINTNIHYTPAASGNAPTDPHHIQHFRHWLIMLRYRNCQIYTPKTGDGQSHDGENANQLISEAL